MSPRNVDFLRQAFGGYRFPGGDGNLRIMVMNFIVEKVFTAPLDLRARGRVQGAGVHQSESQPTPGQQPDPEGRDGARGVAGKSLDNFGTDSTF